MEYLVELTRSIREIRAEARERQREVAAQMQETDRRMQETDRRMRETDRRLKRAEDLFTTQWGKLMESLVEGDLVRLLKLRGVAVEGTLQRSRKRRNGEHFEIDILATNGREVVAVEVKTTLRPEGVGRFVEKLSRFLEWYPEYRGRTVYGAVAYLEGGDSVTAYAERQGLFVIRATGNSASIVNAEDFQPRSFA
jgi:RecB family endonuclease NucS